MRITTDTQETTLIGAQANSFQLTNSAKIIDIVINKMYTNKPGAVIRELSSNAWDSHCAKGNPETPFEITLPTWLDKTFSIRDYGCGIPHDKFENIYTNIGGSTKDSSDEFIGGFGLGSKTPFTMVDSFTVVNWRDGEKSTWLCFKSQGQPMVNLLAKEPSNEPSGLQVMFTFKDDEVSEFARQITKQLKYFPTKPVITGEVEAWDELPDGWETKDYFYTRANSWKTEHQVVMGNVAYTLDRWELDSKHSPLFSKSLTLKVPIGSVDIPPSRENIEYTKKTKDYLHTRFDVLLAEYKKDFQNAVDNCSTYIDLRKLCYNTNSQIVGKDSIVFENKEYPWKTLRHHYLNEPFNIKCINNNYVNSFRKTKIHMRDVTKGLQLYINDTGSISYVNQECSKIPSGVYIIDPTKGTKKTRQALLDADIREAKRFFGIEPVLLSTLIGFPDNTPLSSNRAKPDQIFKVVRAGNKVRDCLDKVDTIPTDGYILNMVGWDVEGIFKGKITDIAYAATGLDIYLVRKNSRKLCTHLKDQSQLSVAIDKLLTPEYLRYINRDKLIHILHSVPSLKQLDWKGVDNVLYLLTKFYYRCIPDPVPYDRQQAIQSLLSVKPEPTLFISTRTQSLIDTYNTKYKDLVTGLYNLTPLHTFLQENK